MQFFSIFASTLFVTVTLTSAELNYNVNSKNNNERELQREGGGLSGCWGQFHQDGFCLEKIFDAQDATSDKVKFAPCDDMVAAQMWKFDKDINDNLPNFYEYGGLLYNMEGGCLAIRGDVEAGKNLKVLSCDRNNDKQHWLSDGDTLVPRDSREFCVSPIAYPIDARDPVVLLSCEDTFSLDY